MQTARAAGLLLALTPGVGACWLDDISLGGAGGSGGASVAVPPSVTASTTSVTTSISSTSTGVGGEGGATPTELCGDGLDNDGDEDVDCGDIDCALACPGSCGSPVVLDGPMIVEGDNTGAPSRQAASCSSDSGPEVFYAVVAPFDGVLQALLYSEPNLDISVRTNCPDDPSERACENKGAQRFTESLVTPVAGGETYFIMIDAYSPGEIGSFLLDIEFQTSPGESVCDDLDDNDGDGLTDCEDAFNCRAYNTCIPGGMPVGAPCFEASECAAGGGAPLCINEARFGFPQGYCSEFCDLSLEGCGGEGLCVDMGLPSGNGLCFQGCASGAVCPPDYACADIGFSRQICVAAERCDDLADNDGDGATDCADGGCSGFLPCVCDEAAPIALGTTTGDTTAGTLAFRGSCTSGGDAPEDLYTFTPPATGTLTITLSSDADQGIYVFAGCSDPSSELACAHLGLDGAPETLSIAVSAGAPVSIVVDGYSGPADAGPYALMLALAVE